MVWFIGPTPQQQLGSYRGSDDDDDDGDDGDDNDDDEIPVSLVEEPGAPGGKSHGRPVACSVPCTHQRS